GDALPDPDARRALGDDRPDQRPDPVPPEGQRWPPIRALVDTRGVDDVPRARDPVLQGAAPGLVPLLDEGPRRTAATRRPPTPPRVHHEGLILVRHGRVRSRCLVQGT